MDEKPIVTTGASGGVSLPGAPRSGEKGGNCLSASVLFCLRKARVPVKGMRTTVETRMARNAKGRLRIGGVAVRIALDLAPEDEPRKGRCLELFEDFCVVTQSVRGGIPVDVFVEFPGPRPSGPAPDRPPGGRA